MAVLVPSMRFYSHRILTNYVICRSSYRCQYLINIRKFGFISKQRSPLLISPYNCILRNFSGNVRKDSSKRVIFSWKSLIISGGIVAIFLVAFLQFKREKMMRLEKERKRSLGKASIGGHFDLIDQNGKRMSSKDLLGKWVLIYFGFTHCPDICPDEIEKMVKAIEIVEKMSNTDEVIPLFITVDPERDSPEAIKGYLKEFSHRIIGLTGTKEEVEAATRAYRVYYSAGPRDHEDDYIVDHTIIMYLINPKGEFIDYYGQTKTAEDVANGVAFNMIKFRKTNKTFGIF